MLAGEEVGRARASVEVRMMQDLVRSLVAQIDGLWLSRLSLYLFLAFPPTCMSGVDCNLMSHQMRVRNLRLYLSFPLLCLSDPSPLLLLPLSYP
jgi:hypothetical protein